MRHRLLIIVLAAVILMSGIGFDINIVHTAAAAVVHRSTNKYCFYPHHVVTTKNIYAVEIKRNFFRTPYPYLRKKLIKKGTPLTINYSGTGIFCWVLWGKIKGIGKAVTPHKNFWAIRTNKANWFKLSHPAK